MKKKLLILGAFILMFTINVNADTKLEDKNNLNVDEEITLVNPNEVDLIEKAEYRVYDRINISNPIIGSGFYLGETVTQTSTIDGIGVIGGLTVNIYGSVDYGLFFGQNINIYGTINNDAFIAAKEVIIGEKALLKRDLFIATQKLTIDGTVGRNLNVATGQLTIKKDAILTGNIYIGAENITIEEGASISGLLEYNDDAKVNIFNKEAYNIKTYESKNHVPQFNIVNTLTFFLNSLLALIIVFVIFILLFPKTFENASKACDEPKDLAMNIILGFGVLIVIPVGAMIISIIPFAYAISLLAIGFYLISLYLAYMVTGYIIGEYVLKLLKQKFPPIAVGLIGILILKVLCLIHFFSLIAMLFGLGTITKLIFPKK